MRRVPPRPTTSASGSSSGGRRLAGLAAALLLLPACVSFRVPVPDEAELTVAYLAVVPAVDESGRFDGIVQSQPVALSAEAVCALVKIRRIRRPVVLSWGWYAPDATRVRQSPPLEVNSRRATLEYAVAWDRLPRPLFAGRPGLWQVVINADGRFLACTTFQVPSGD